MVQLSQDLEETREGGPEHFWGRGRPGQRTRGQRDWNQLWAGPAPAEVPNAAHKGPFLVLFPPWARDLGGTGRTGPQLTCGPTLCRPFCP